MSQVIARIHRVVARASSLLLCAMVASTGLAGEGAGDDADGTSEAGLGVIGSGPPSAGPLSLEGVFRVQFGQPDGGVADVGWIDIGPAENSFHPVVGGSLGAGYFEGLSEGAYVGILQDFGGSANPLVVSFNGESFAFEFDVGSEGGVLLPAQDPQATQDPKPDKGRRKVVDPKKPTEPIIIFWCIPKPDCTYDWLQFMTITAKVKHTTAAGVVTEKKAGDDLAMPTSGNGGGRDDAGKPIATDEQQANGAGTQFIDGTVTYVDSLKPGVSGYRAAGGTGGRDRNGNESMIDQPVLPADLAKAIGNAIDPPAGPYPAGTKHELVFTISFWTYFTCNGDVTASCHWTITWTYDLLTNKFVGGAQVELGEVKPATNDSLTEGEKFALDNYESGKFDGGKSSH